MSPDPSRARSGLADRAVFAAQFARAPLATASVWPSSGGLARAVAAAALDPLVDDPAPAPAPVVVELGAGSGAFTAALASRVPDGARVLAVELNETLARRLAQRFADTDLVEVVTADATDLRALLEGRGIAEADVVVSGLGWSATRPGHADSLVSTAAAVLAPRGRLIQFCYTWTQWAAPARALRAELDAAFTLVEHTATVRANLPPAAVLRAIGPRRP